MTTDSMTHMSDGEQKKMIPTTKARPVKKPKPVTPKPPEDRRTIRIDEETWQAAKAAAANEGLTTSEVVRFYLRLYAGLDQD